MKLIIVVLFVTSTIADKLQNNYLPPGQNARTAGASDFLTAPSRTSNVLTRFRTNGPSSGSFAPSGRSNLNSFNFPSATFKTSESYSSGPPIPIVRSSSENDGVGSYRFAYETDNRISQEEEGHLENVGTSNEANTVRGSYSFQAPDGQIFTVNYIADENGFRAFGDHLPTAPPISEAIQRSLELNKAAERYESNSDSGHYYDNSRAGARSAGLSRTFPRNPFNSNKANQRNFDANEFDDLNGVEVGVPEIDVSKQYLTPNDRPREGGYRY